MSKLYLQGGTDARKTALTARAHREGFMKFLYNWKGGNVAVGVSCEILLRGNSVYFTANVMGTRDGFACTFHDDGTYEVTRFP